MQLPKRTSQSCFTHIKIYMIWIPKCSTLQEFGSAPASILLELLEFFDMPYTNPLHPPVVSTQSTSFNSIGMAVTTPPHPSQFISSTRQLLPQESKTSAAARSQRSAPAIPFDYIGFHKQGVPMRELSSRGIFALGSMIVSANEQIFVRSNLKSIVLRIVVCTPSFRIIWGNN